MNVDVVSSYGLYLSKIDNSSVIKIVHVKQKVHERMGREKRSHKLSETV